MTWIYLSPHLDDVAFSCGGLVWEQVQAGENVQLWTICAGDPPPGPVSSFAQSLHDRWGAGAASGDHRRAEDLLASRLLGANPLHFHIPDCIYRRGKGDEPFLYDTEASLFGELHPSEHELVTELAKELTSTISANRKAHSNLVCPLALGGHVDHRLTRQAAELLECRQPAGRLWYYADFPYLLDDLALFEQLSSEGWEAEIFPVSPRGLEAWQRSMAAYASQISTFWTGIPEMKAAIKAYCEQSGGVRLWRKHNFFRPIT